MNGYETFLMIELAKEKGLISRELEYDLQWDEGNKLLSEFEATKFYTEKMGLYECMSSFLDWYIENKRLEMIKDALFNTKDEIDVEIKVEIKYDELNHFELRSDIESGECDRLYFESSGELEPNVWFIVALDGSENDEQLIFEYRYTSQLEYNQDVETLGINN